MKKWYSISILLFIILENPSPSFSLEPDEVLVLVNTRDTHSLELAKYYAKKRNIPDENMFRMRLTERETCSFKEYKDKVEEPVRKYIIKYELKGKIRCILLMYGMPLKFTHPDKEETGTKTKSASLDSELALIFEEKYDLSGWQPNPFYVGYHNKYEAKRDYVLMVSRLDGPDTETVKRIIDDSIAAENTGLTGNAYFDARWPENTSKKELSGYKLYDNSIYNAADLIKKSELMPVKINTENELFKEGECPDAALYCGWYSLRKYVGAFTWKRGSVGYHIASGECTTLKNPGSRVWCKRMLEQGIAATVGPVREPYVQAFPLPELFFRFLTDGYWTLAESYALSQPFWSWQMVLIGDPLYRPFKNKIVKD
jgi:uncharacterized protein (TIGR03790 family)